jgi:hypothetical protein
MLSIADTLLAEFRRIERSKVNGKTISALRQLHGQVTDFVDSLVPKDKEENTQVDFNLTLEELLDKANTLDDACDEYEIADDKESRDDAIAAAEDALVDLRTAINNITGIAEYIRVDEKSVFARYNDELTKHRITPVKDLSSVIDALIAKSRTTKEKSILVDIAKRLIFQNR